MVGRDEELAALAGWFAEARAGAPRVVLLGGEAGIGKTRLAHELAGRISTEGATTAWGRGTEQPGAPPFWPWLQVLDQLGLPPVLEADPGADPEIDRFARFERATAAVTGAAGAEGLLVVLDDVHQVDEASLRLLVHLAGAAHGRLLVLATHRTSPADHAAGFGDAVDALVRLPVTRRLVLDGLDGAAVAALLGVAPDDPAATQAIEGSGGNPLLAGELARHLRAGHDPATVPPSIRDAVRARLAERSQGCLRTLEVAAVVGREFDAGLVATTTGEPAVATLEGIEEAIAAGLVEGADRPGRFRFVHALVRDAVEATLGAAALPALHRRVAEAIEAYDGSGDGAVTELARHWSEAATLGDRDVAASWCERAAELADRRTAWEEAVRLYDRSAELTGSEVDPVVRHRRLLGSARALLHCDEITVAVDRAAEAAGTVRGLGRPDLVAEACLIAEGRAGPPLARLQSIAEEALAELDPAAHALRARLLGQLALVAFYLDPVAVEGHSLASLAEADLAEDPLADVAAARARQMALIEPEHAEARLELAARIGVAGRALHRPTITQWEPIWRIDALLELGRVGEATEALVSLRRLVASIGLPMSHWHLARCEALLAQTVGRFDEAVAWSERAADLYARLEDPTGGRPIHHGFLVSVQRHTGLDPALGREVLDWPYHLAPPFLGDLPRLSQIHAHLAVGDPVTAGARYDELPSVPTWRPPAFLSLFMHVLRTGLAVTLGRTHDLPALLEVLERHRGIHTGPTAGGVTYNGPNELWIGTARAALGEHDAAVADLRHSLAVTIEAGTRGYAVQAAAELAGVLAARGGPGDAAEAVELATAWRGEAATLGMAPWLARLEAVAAGAGGSADDPGPLSARELEVAGLVARGLTNKQIAAELYLSERTAQNHVQHILTKLGVANRTQVAAWFNDR